MRENIIAVLESGFYLKTGYISEGFLGHAFEPVCTKMSYSTPTIEEWRDRHGDGI